MSDRVKRVFPAHKFPLMPDEDGCLPECPFGVKVNPAYEECPNCHCAGNSFAQCLGCTNIGVARINSPTCQCCVYYIQEMDDHVICSHPEKN